MVRSTDRSWYRYSSVVPGEYLHNSNNDEREWIEEQQVGPEGDSDVIPAYYEPMGPYLRKKIMELISSLNKIKL
jgi:hypothetical protein